MNAIYLLELKPLTQVKEELEIKSGSGNAIHFVDILMQHSKLQTLTNAEGATLRDQFMAEKCIVDFAAGAAK